MIISCQKLAGQGASRSWLGEGQNKSGAPARSGNDWEDAHPRRRQVTLLLYGQREGDEAAAEGSLWY